MGTLCAAHIFRREALRDNKSFFTALWDMAASLRLTIATLIILSVVSIIGTVLPQGRPPAEYVANYGENAYNLFSLLDFTDMYRSWWFLGLLVLFCLNLTACSAKRFPTVWRAIRNPNRTPDNSFYRNLSNREEFAVAAPAADVLERITAFMGTRFARPVSTREGGRIHLFAEKSPYARLGVYITHLSILVILVGAIIGNIWGFKAYVNIVEGTSADKVLPRDGGPPIELGFKLHVDEFDVKYYEGSSRPKEYMSVLNVIEDGQKVISGRKIVVNDPLTYKGITFYQSSYGSAGDPLFKLRVHPAGGEPFETTVPLGESVTLPDGSSYAVTNYAASYDQFGRPFRCMSPLPTAGRPTTSSFCRTIRTSLSIAAAPTAFPCSAGISSGIPVSRSTKTRSLDGLGRLFPDGGRLPGRLFPLPSTYLGHPRSVRKFDRSHCGRHRTPQSAGL
jgi:cytochrome c biogenesis protein